MGIPGGESGERERVSVGHDDAFDRMLVNSVEMFFDSCFVRN